MTEEMLKELESLLQDVADSSYIAGVVETKTGNSSNASIFAKRVAQKAKAAFWRALGEAV